MVSAVQEFSDEGRQLDRISEQFGLSGNLPTQRIDLAVGSLRGIDAVDRLWMDLPEVDVWGLLASYPGTQITGELAASLTKLRAVERGEALNPNGFVTTHGALDGLAHALAPLPPGSTVLCPEPSWIFDVPIARAGHRHHPVPWSIADPTSVWLEAVEAAASVIRGQAGLIVNFPRNPSGVLATEADWVHLSNIVDRYGVLLVVDDVYGFLDREPRSLTCDPDFVVVVDSVSKRLAAPGLRLGSVYCTPRNVRAVRASASRTSVGVSPLAAHLAAIALERYVRNEVVEDVLATLQRRRESIHRAALVEALDARMLIADHGFYACLRVSRELPTRRYLEALRDRGVAMSAGQDASGPYLRLCVGSDDRVGEAVSKAASVFRELEGSRPGEMVPL